MKSLKTKTRIEIAVMVAATAVLAAGCSSCKTTGQTSYAKPAPVYPSAGAPPAEVQTETAAATSVQGNNVVIPLEKEQLQVATQQIPAGSVKIHKYVKTETVTQPVTIRSETVSIERMPPGSAPPAGSQAASGDINKPFQGGEVVINLNKEEPLISTQIVPAGSVVVNKQESTQTVNVQRQLRSEDVAAVPSGNSSNVRISGGVSQNAPANEAVGAPSPGISQSSGAATGGITQVEQLSNASDPNSMAGQQVNLSSAPVQKVISPHLIVIGSSGGTPVYVHIGQPSGEVSAGQMVVITGTVQPAPTSGQALDQQSAQALQGQQIFIEAKSVAPASQ